MGCKPCLWQHTLKGSGPESANSRAAPFDARPARMAKAKLKGKAARPSGSAKRDERARRKELQKERRRARGRHSSAEEEAFAAQLAALACRVEAVQSDGNCLFRALADQLGGDEGAHRRVRAELVAYVEAHRDWFEPFMEVCVCVCVWVSRRSHDYYCTTTTTTTTTTHDINNNNNNNTHNTDANTTRN